MFVAPDDAGEHLAHMNEFIGFAAIVAKEFYESKPMTFREFGVLIEPFKKEFEASTFENWNSYVFRFLNGVQLGIYPDFDDADTRRNWKGVITV